MVHSELTERGVRVFEIMSHGPGSRANHVVVDLPTRWARHHQDVYVRLDNTEVSGVRAVLASRDGIEILRFPAYHHAEQQLLEWQGGEYPVALEPNGRWEDIAQGWWATISDVSGTLYIARTDPSALTKAPMPAADVRCQEPGHVVVSGVDIRWHSVPRAAYNAAWREAATRLQDGF